MSQHSHFSERRLFWLLLSLIPLACSSDPESADGASTESAGGSLPSGGGTSAAGGTGGTYASGGAAFGSGGDLGSGGVGFGNGGTFVTGGEAGTGGHDATGGETQGVGGESVGSGGEFTGAGGTLEIPFQPCPESGPCKILPLGDSITVGWGSTNYASYRVELFRQARQDDHEITFTGTKQDGPDMVDGVSFPRKHEGVASETIVQIQGRVDGALSAETPHIVLVHAGTNDVNFTPDGVEDRLPVLVDKLVEDLPDALIVVASIIPFPQFSDRVAAFNATIPAMIQERAAAGDHVIFVDQFEGYPSGNSELPDGVHPNDAGYARMAGKWYEAIEAYLR